MQGFVFRPPPYARVIQGLLPLAIALFVTGQAVRLALQHGPPPDHLLKGAAIIAGVDVLAGFAALLWWRAYVVFDDAGGSATGTPSASGRSRTRRSRASRH